LPDGTYSNTTRPATSANFYTVVPEPGAAAILLGGTLLCLRRRRRRG